MCPFDPESKGGSESSVKVAKADLVPTDYNLLADYDSFGALEATCGELRTELNARPHSVTRRPPAEMLEEERVHLHGIPDAAYTAAFGESRLVGWSSTVSFRGARYSVPHRLAGGQVWVRVAAGEVVIVAGEGSGATEVARHALLHAWAGLRSVTSTTPSEPVIPSTVSPGPPSPPRRPSWPWARGPSSTSSRRPPPGSGASSARWPRRSPWLALHGAPVVDRALGVAAVAGRFADGDLESIIVHASGAPTGATTPPVGALACHRDERLVGLRHHRRGVPVTAPVRFDAADVVEIVELLGFVADV